MSHDRVMRPIDGKPGTWVTYCRAHGRRFGRMIGTKAEGHEWWENHNQGDKRNACIRPPTRSVSNPIPAEPPFWITQTAKDNGQ